MPPPPPAPPGVRLPGFGAFRGLGVRFVFVFDWFGLDHFGRGSAFPVSMLLCVNFGTKGSTVLQRSPERSPGRGLNNSIYSDGPRSDIFHHMDQLICTEESGAR